MTKTALAHENASQL